MQHTSALAAVCTLMCSSIAVSHLEKNTLVNIRGVQRKTSCSLHLYGVTQVWTHCGNHQLPCALLDTHLWQQTSFEETNQNKGDQHHSVLCFFLIHEKVGGNRKHQTTCFKTKKSRYCSWNVFQLPSFSVAVGRFSKDPSHLEVNHLSNRGMLACLKHFIIRLLLKHKLALLLNRSLTDREAEKLEVTPDSLRI